jgi:hypothetical protein
MSRNTIRGRPTENWMEGEVRPLINDELILWLVAYYRPRQSPSPAPGSIEGEPPDEHNNSEIHMEQKGW